MQLSQYAQLIWFRSIADLKAERQRTYLGLLWWLLEPVLFMAVFYVVFGHVRGNAGPEFVAFLLSGLVFWQWFRSVVLHCGNSITSGLRLMRMVALPPIVFPLITIVTDTIKFLIVFMLLLVVLPLLGVEYTLHSLVIVPVLLVELLLIVGLSLVYTAILPFAPDLKYLVDAAMMAMMFLTGIFYRLDSIRGEFAWLVHLNPMAGLIDDARRVLLQNEMPDWSRLATIALTGIGLIILGRVLIRRFSVYYTKLPA